MPLFHAVIVIALLATASGPTTSPGAADPPGSPAADPGVFLESLAGEWSVETESVLGPGHDPVRSESRETARLIGNWLVAESTGEARGRAYTAILTLGFDSHRQRFVGTWIDSIQQHLWQYEGALDETGSVLTLETEGPLMGDPARLVRYREIIQVHGQGHKVMRSQIMGPDGEWFEFSRAEYRRVP